ncbi:hypothetical protein CH333_05020 [candidate division WOR-3 bacterium JGI_Cruoil_03_44_89]|uniref:AAA family ATPase n=1 Tax=candidate division WOR-3 bacterium JGI_Cruoil_03_44_89 TaxID=1973748 RepID=A0A235BTX2_UNCW3|nr:MAG: hypothetical protein CH333_05020 [candidate division WOR-3 bacterium JGI_Cruoil_03_44_89]
MIDKNIIKGIVIEWLEEIKKKRVMPRDAGVGLKRYIEYKHVVALTGMRRSGKTYLMFQFIQGLLKENPNNVFYINFEDERLSFVDVMDMGFIYETFLELRNPTGQIYFFLDEVQHIKGWEKWVSRMYEKGLKFFVSGSNASLLNSEYSSVLTGRHISFRVFPLSFKEFIRFKSEELLREESLYLPDKRAKIKMHLEEFISNGGLPEVVYEDRKDILQQYFNDILVRDIIFRYRLKFKETLKTLAIYLLTNTSSLTSLYSLKRAMGERSINTIKSYLSYLEESFLLFRLPFFSFSVKRQMLNPFKVYATDTGLRNAVSFQVSSDYGKLYENVVAVELKRRGKEIYYWRDYEQREVDFVVKEGLDVTRLIQVCYNIEDPKVNKREVKALLKASSELRCQDLLIITKDYEAVEKDKKELPPVKFTPLWKWLCLPE